MSDSVPFGLPLESKRSGGTGLLSERAPIVEKRHPAIQPESAKYNERAVSN